MAKFESANTPNHPLIRSFPKSVEMLEMIKKLHDAIDSDGWSVWWSKEINVCGISLFGEQELMVSVTFGSMKVKIKDNCARKADVTKVLDEHKDMIGELKAYIMSSN